MVSSRIARSISQPVREQLTSGPFTARVLSSFEQACNLVTPDGDVVTLVIPQVGNGPLNIVVENEGRLLPRISDSAPVTLEREQLLIGDLQIDLTKASIWNPQPDWGKLRKQFAAIIPRLQYLRQVGHDHAPPDSLLTMLKRRKTGNKLLETILSTVEKAGQDLQEGWDGDPDKFRKAGTKLAGLGYGLTPAGDDFLAGIMLWAWLAHPNPGACCDPLVQVAAPRTTRLSAAFLRSAARGECNIWWHALLDALSESTLAEIATTAQMVLARGATSGADTLAGFLYLSAKLS